MENKRKVTYKDGTKIVSNHHLQKIESKDWKETQEKFKNSSNKEKEEYINKSLQSVLEILVMTSKISGSHKFEISGKEENGNFLNLIFEIRDIQKENFVELIKRLMDTEGYTIEELNNLEYDELINLLKKYKE